jgi:hypothetical protein
MTLVAFFHSHYNHLPTVMEVSTYGKFIDCCGTVATDWAHLMNKETGEVLQTWRKDSLTVSQLTRKGTPYEQSTNRLNRP